MQQGVFLWRKSPWCLIAPWLLFAAVGLSGARAGWVRCGPGGGRIPALAAAPSNPSVLYAGGAFVYRSADGGKTWTRAADVFPSYGPEAAPPRVNTLVVCPTDPNRVAALSPQGVFLTTSGGAAWTRIAAITADIISLAFAADGRRACASGGNVMYRSLNAGDTWTSASVPTMAALGPDPRVATGLFGVRQAADTQGRTVYHTDDALTWTSLPAGAISASAIAPSATGDAVYIVASGGGGVYRMPRSGAGTAQISILPAVGVAVMPGTAGWLNIATTGASPTAPAYRTMDDGRNWTALKTGFMSRGPLCITVNAVKQPLAGTERGGVLLCDADDAWYSTNDGLDMATLTGAALDEATGVLLAAAGDGLYRSTDDGATWVNCHPSTSRSLLAASTVRCGRVVHTGASGLEKSEDNGRTWSGADSGLPLNSEAARIVLDPADPDTMFAVTANGAVYRSTTSIADWKRVLAAWSPAPVTPPDIAIAPSRPKTLYAVRKDGLYQSQDGGNTWALRAATPPDSLLAVDPANPATLYRATTSGTTVTVGRSTNAGLTWTALKQETGAANSGFAATFLAIDPREPRRILLGTNRGLRVSSDSGATWRTESIGSAGTFCAAWAPAGESGDLLATAGAGLLRTVASSGGRAFSVSDAVFIARVVTGKASLPADQQAAYDLNSDGRITMGDANLALRRSAGL